MDTATLSTEAYANTHALLVREHGAVHVLFVAASTLTVAEQRQACENVRARIIRAVAAEGLPPQDPAHLLERLPQATVDAALARVEREDADR